MKLKPKKVKSVRAWAVGVSMNIYQAAPMNIEAPYPFAIYETREEAKRMVDITTKFFPVEIAHSLNHVGGRR